jgi:hypothetical protein
MGVSQRSLKDRMIVYAIQWHGAPLPPHEDVEDLNWTTWPGHDDYSDESEADEAAREFDAAFDGAYAHRVVARRVDGPGVARTRGAPVAATGQPTVDNSKAILADPRGRAPRRA